MSAEEYINEYENFKNLLETVSKTVRRKKDPSTIPIAFLCFASAYVGIPSEEIITKWKGMIRLLETGFDKKILNESEREVVAAILLLSTEMRSKKDI